MQGKWLIGLMLLGIAGATQAGIYRWVDENGTVHYGERAPADTRAREVPIEKAPPADPLAAERQRRMNRFVEIRERERAARDQTEAEAKRQAEKRAYNCRIARDRLQRLRQAGLVYDIDENGKRVYRDDAGREQAIAQAEEKVRYWCRE